MADLEGYTVLVGDPIESMMESLEGAGTLDSRGSRPQFVDR